jgi:hypothetical protein
MNIGTPVANDDLIAAIAVLCKSSALKLGRLAGLMSDGIVSFQVLTIFSAIL